MNSVHLVTQEKKRVKTDRKWAECTECTAQGQPARPAPRPLSCRAPAAHAPRAPRVAACSPRALPRARAYRLRAQHLACAPSAPPKRPAPRLRAPFAPCAPSQRPAPSPLSQYNFVLRYSLASCSLLQYNTLYCNTALQQPFQSIAIQSSLHLCNTTTVLQHKNPYTSLLTCNTILYCN